MAQPPSKSYQELVGISGPFCELDTANAKRGAFRYGEKTRSNSGAPKRQVVGFFERQLEVFKRCSFYLFIVLGRKIKGNR